MLSSNVLSEVFIVKCYSKSLLLHIQLDVSYATTYIFRSDAYKILQDLKRLRASSYKPGQPGWLGFRDLASPLFSL